MHHPLLLLPLLLPLLLLLLPLPCQPRTEEQPTPELPSSTEAAPRPSTPSLAPAAAAEQCFHRGRAACPPPAAPARCRTDSEISSAVVCCDVAGLDKLLEGFYNTIHLAVRVTPDGIEGLGFHQGRAACPPPAAPARCRTDSEISSAVVCCDVAGLDKLLEGFYNTSVGNENVTSLHIINATLPYLSRSFMTKTRWLHSLAITDGRLRNISEAFKKNTPILCLNMSNNGIEHVGKRVLYHLRHMKRLDLSHNNLTDLPNYHQDAKITLDISSVGNENVTSLHIINATLPYLSRSFMTKTRWLHSLAITDGRLRNISEAFKKNTPILCLNMSNNGIEHVGKRVLYHLRHMKRLDLSHNNLTDLPNYHQDAKITLDISNNNKTLCQSLLNAKNSSTIFEFENVNHTFCSISKSFHWFNSTELLPLEQVDKFFNARKNCWSNCTCEYYRTDYVQGKLPTIAFKVDCAGKHLTEMPEVLPANTIVLNISNNNISVLRMGNESFENIRELYADNNQIMSITSLEGTKFLDNFRRLSLRNNSLKTIPMYMLSYIFDRNIDAQQVFFGQNRLHCECNTAKNLKMSLLTKKKYIPDYDEIYCENNAEVINLDPAVMCQDTHQTWTDYIYYIISVEVILLVGLVLKVSYDYWVFKTAGYLPWPANKMPKLPCDWLCE